MGFYCRTYQDQNGKDVKHAHDWDYDERVNDALCVWCGQLMSANQWFKDLEQKVKDMVK